jgi:hypothetical protein
MAIVNAVRFDGHSGAMAADEESWHLRRRKTYFSGALYDLSAPPGGKGVTAMYGGAGDPSFHHEVAARARKALAGKKPSSVEELGRTALEAMHAVVRRIADGRLRFLFGFGADDLNRGHFEAEGESFEIRNASILKSAREIVEGKSETAAREGMPANHACLMGVDAEGFHAFCLKEADGVLSFNAGDFESLGSGCASGGMRFGGFLGRKTLAERRKGFTRREGMRVLLDSMIDAASSFGMVGGRFHLAVVDGRKPAGSRLLRIEGARSVLAAEAVRAVRGGFVGEAEGLDLMEEILFGRIGMEAAEGRLRKAAKDPDGLDLYLRGYKVEPGRAGGGGKGRGKRRGNRG